MKDNHQSANEETSSSGDSSIFEDDFEDDELTTMNITEKEAMEMSERLRYQNGPVFGMMQGNPQEITHLPPISSIFQYIDEATNALNCQRYRRESEDSQESDYYGYQEKKNFEFFFRPSTIT